MSQPRATQQVDPLRLESQLCFSLYAASRLVTRAYQPLLAPLGLTYPQYVVMLILWQDAPCRVTQIGERALLSSNTLTPLLKRLEQLGYVTRARDPEDERVVQIGLTPSGVRLRGSCACIPEKLVAGASETSLAELAELKSSLDRLIESMQTTAETTD